MDISIAKQVRYNQRKSENLASILDILKVNIGNVVGFADHLTYSSRTILIYLITLCNYIEQIKYSLLLSSMGKEKL